MTGAPDREAILKISRGFTLVFPGLQIGDDRLLKKFQNDRLKAGIDVEASTLGFRPIWGVRSLWRKSWPPRHELQNQIRKAGQNVRAT
jgi:hypothetical protein